MAGQNLGDCYWLYVVVHCADQPQLYVIGDPAARVLPQQELKVAGYQLGAADRQGIAERQGLGYGT